MPAMRAGALVSSLTPEELEQAMREAKTRPKEFLRDLSAMALDVLKGHAAMVLTVRDAPIEPGEMGALVSFDCVWHPTFTEKQGLALVQASLATMLADITKRREAAG
jgi:hypothetical protein